MRTAVISGGNGGLGLALAARLEAAGWHCVLMDRDISGLKVSETRTPVQVDLTEDAALEDAAARVIATRPSIDMVVYNAGVSQIGPFAESDEASHRRVFEINYFAAVAMARAFLVPIRESGGVHLAISSVAGFAPLKNRTAYAASKHAMEGFFGSLRSEEAVHGVRCVIAAPSFVATNIGNTGRGADGIVRPGSASDGVDYMRPEEAAAV
ncbi:short-chain dehydrogenase, partial [Roseovarius sp. HI0049]